MRKRRRGGPLAPDDTEQLRIVRGWLRVQGRMNQEVYAREQGISPATLRRWMRQLEAQGKL
ncbi:MAG TPA: helix-turn-helix domain-containing protein [Anaerolineae bacterium]|nr:helix-turn-helix domain-containing protein [Anaerolineae bacterium]